MTRVSLVCIWLLSAVTPQRIFANQIDIAGPPGSVQFGSNVAVLPNGNIVVVDRVGPASNLGAAHLYSPGGQIISSVTGSSSGDRVGSGGITVLSNGNFVISSPDWDNGGATDAGAVTWASGETGIAGTISAANSLVGTTAGDRIGWPRLAALPNGNYVVCSPYWDGEGAANVGAATWVNGAIGATGTITPANSLVGTSTGDFVGSECIAAVSNDHYVVLSTHWANGAALNAGAATWADASKGPVGAVSPTNSLVGTTTNDLVGIGGVTVLSNGNYVIASDTWDNGGVTDVGATTWADGGKGISGAVSPSNSLIGATSGDSIGFTGIVPLRNGNYVVVSSGWGNGTSTGLGAVTWANGSQGLVGTVSPSNSLTGTTPGDQVGGVGGVAALTNGHYVVQSGNWDNDSVADVGAVTWANGDTGLIGTVSPSNSLIGLTAGDRVGSGGSMRLANGNYVVCSSNWDNGTAVNAGAATWASGSTGLTGVVSPTNSLVGSTTNDLVCLGGVTALSNGNYVVPSYQWDNGGTPDVGAATWGDGTKGIVGAVGPGNSLIGTSGFDSSAGLRITGLVNGNYVVAMEGWDNGPTADVGAVTWVNGTTGYVGSFTQANSLIGSTTADRVGLVGALVDGNYVIRSSAWDNLTTMDAGAYTLVRGDVGLVGTIGSANSVLGTLAGGGSGMVIDYDAAREQLVVGQPAKNTVSLFKLPASLIFAHGFE